jgi:methionyl-tRNA formyltransferase
MGTPELGATVLKALAADPRYELTGVVTQPDRPAGRKNILTPPPVKVAAQELGLPFMQVEKLRNLTAISQLQEFSREAEVFVVAAFGMLLPQAVLEMPLHGCINVHGSLLPEYRGASPVAQAILDGKTETGVTIMLMDRGLDTGPMLSKVVIPIAPEETQPTLMDKIAKAGATLLLETLPELVAGKIIAEPQDHNRATLTSIIKKEDGLIDWQKSAEEIERMSRAYYPWPGIFTTWQGQSLKLTRVVLYSDSEQPNGTIPGSVKAVKKGATVQLIVTTGSGYLQLVELQLAGKKATPAVDFLRGYPTFQNSKLNS